MLDSLPTTTYSYLSLPGQSIRSALSRLKQTCPVGRQVALEELARMACATALHKVGAPLLTYVLATAERFKPGCTAM